ncbi:MAG: glycosyltransferase family 4 protein [Candidatus Omnitrophota bacterium]
MHILFFTTHLNYGGIANYVVEMASSLVKKGLAITVASSGGDLEGSYASDRLKYARIDIRTKFEFGPKVMMAVPKLSRMITDGAVDIVHAHTRVTQVAACFATLRTGVPSVSTCHGYFKTRLGRRIFGCWGKKVVAISGPVRDHLVNDLKVDERSIALIHTGINIDKFSMRPPDEELASLRKTHRFGDGPVIGTIGRMSPVKGHEFFVRAFQHVLKKRPDAMGVIVGDGPDKAMLARLIETLEIGDSFRLVEPTTDTVKYYSAFDIFVLPSVSEGLGLSLLEAMAAGTPCVASNVGGVKDIINDTGSGLLVPPEDPGSLSEAIVTMLDDDSLRKRVREGARARVEEKFSIQHAAEKMRSMYEEVAAAASSVKKSLS